MTRYFTSSSRASTVKYGELTHALNVLKAPNGGTIGMAFEAGWTKDRLALFRLLVNNVEIPGQFIEIPGRFILSNGDFHQVD
jgi:hypothetical protein